MYLIDTSVLGRFANKSISDVVLGPISRGEVALCSPVVFELGYTAKNAKEYSRLMDTVAAYPTVELNQNSLDLAIEIQNSLVKKSQHRGVSLVDALVSAAAIESDLVVWHYDSDFELIAKHFKSLNHRWVVPRGSID